MSSSSPALFLNKTPEKAFCIIIYLVIIVNLFMADSTRIDGRSIRILFKQIRIFVLETHNPDSLILTYTMGTFNLRMYKNYNFHIFVELFFQ